MVKIHNFAVFYILLAFQAGACFAMSDEAAVKSLHFLLARGYMEKINSIPTGKQLLGKISYISGRKARAWILPAGGMTGDLASFSYNEGVIKISSYYILKMLKLPAMSQAELARYLIKHKSAREFLINSTDIVIVHELVHLLQSHKYDYFFREKTVPQPIEFELEAAFTQEMYLAEKT